MIQVLGRAFLLLDLLHEREPQTLAELTRATGLQKPTVHNILKTLSAHGAVCRTPDGRYALGPKLGEWAGPAAPRSRRALLLPLAQRAADNLAARIDEAVAASTLDGDQEVLLARATGTRLLTVRLDAPAHAPRRSPYAACAGRVLLAYLDPAQRAAFVEKDGYPGAAWDGITAEADLEAALGSIRAVGVAFQKSPDEQVQVVAVPVFGPDGAAWAALAVHLPASRFTGRHRTEVIVGLKAAAGEASDALAAALPRSPA